ncbi:hypothetical protein ABT237_02370 [Streptomyces sp. NPDC001581]|uniref:hypothetical protein n=1 Tax=Streptomyces sp. NPDC001581 TaxID=3154386 RepID=UPI003330A50F
MGGTFATRSGSGRMRAFIVNGRERNPGQQAKARALPLGVVRSIGAFLAVGGLVAVTTAVGMMTGG